MSELRQRRGDKEDDFQNNLKDTLTDVLSEKARKEGKGEPAEVGAQVAEELAKILERSQKKILPGITNVTKKAKDQLATDPYNMQYIFELGTAYVDEGKFTEATNVMIRGFKRASELVDAEARFEYLYYLCLSSYRCKKFKQALAILMDMEEPEDAGNLSHYSLLACQVYCQNGSLQKALKAFHNSLETCGDASDDLLSLWGQTYGGLRKVGAYDAAKSKIETLVTSEEGKKQLEAFDRFGDIADQMEAELEAQEGNLFMKILLMIFLIMVIGAVIYALYLFETRNLKQMNILK